MNNEEKLAKVVKLAQSYILLFLREYIEEEKIKKIKELFNSCPVIIEKMDGNVNEFGKITTIGGIASEDKIVINLDTIKKTNIDNEHELNNLIGTIIHEYAHKIRKIDNIYGEMLEESFASIFAEVCINNARKDNEQFEMLNSVKYQRYESEVRGLLYVLKQNNIDLNVIAEYIAGSKDKFIEICTKVFGSDFINYYNSISSRNNEKSEELLINIITKYIKEKGLDISNYWKKDDDLYFRGSPTLCMAVVNSGIESFNPEEKEYYRYYVSSLGVDVENREIIQNEKVDRMRKYIDDNFSLVGKNGEEIYDTVIDLCSSYTQNKVRDNDESKLFIEELLKIIPYMEDFKRKFVILRVSGLDGKLFEELNLDNVTYDSIYNKMNELLNSLEENDEFSR